jgi:serine protease AprX
VGHEQLKCLLRNTAQLLPAADVAAQGKGLIDLKRARDTKTPNCTQTHVKSTGSGSLDAARGSSELVMDGIGLDGERDIFGTPFVAPVWALKSAARASWVGGDWNGNRWSGNRWSGNRWSGETWAAGSWSGNRWSAEAWSGNRWSGNRWSGNRWSGNRWSSSLWSGNRWSNGTWQ